MAAAIFAAGSGAAVTLYEKNEKLGKKLFITGKGRCNFTNACTNEELLANVVSNSKFLYSAFSSLSANDANAFIERLGVRTKVERGRRAFPASDHSSDIIRAMEREMKRLGVDIRLNQGVSELIIKDGRACGVVLADKSTDTAQAVIVATGGLSYPSTGSSGDGYAFAKNANLRVSELRAALVPLESAEEYIKRLQGLSLKNVRLTIKKEKKVLYSDFGEMLFTHFGVSGPLVISASSLIGKRLEKGALSASIDLKPALTLEQLDARILREFSENKNKSFKNAIAPLFPSKLIPVMIELSGIKEDTQVNAISRGERLAFAQLIKNFGFTVTGLRSYNEAVITQGGVSVKEISPQTMEAKSVGGLYFIGEVLDVDALTGGYNLQIAWATAYKAAESAAK